MKAVNLTKLVVLAMYMLPCQARSQSMDAVWDFEFVDISVEQALDEVTVKTGFVLSYNPATLPVGDSITKAFEQVNLTTLLKDLVGDDINILQRGSYIIIQKERKVPRSKLDVEGLLIDRESGLEIADASVLDVNTLTASLSDASGKYQVRLSGKYDEVGYLVTKKNYKDTLIIVRNGQAFPKTITLTKAASEATEEPEIDKSRFFKTVVSNRLRRHLQNVNMGEERFGQISLFPGFGTNGLLAGKITNYVSVNATVGLSYGIKGVDLSGAASIVRADLRGAQIAGAASYVGGDMKGAQFAGAVNTTFGNSTGSQIAGALNVNRGKFKGMQVAGAANNALDIKGIQMAGAVNWSEELRGLQLAGALNYAHGSARGLQVAGAVNYVKDEMSGLQVAGFLNYAYTLSGVQIGVVNVVNEDKGGISLGLFNVVKGGLKALELAGNDIAPFNVSFRMGTSRFYNIYQVGIQPWAGEFWHYGMGLGTHFELPRQYFGNIEAIYLDIRPTSGSSDGNYNIARSQINLGYQLNKRLAIVGGPALNIAIRDRTIPDTFDLEPGWLLLENDDVSMWIGYRLGLRF